MSSDLVFYTNPMSRGRIVRWMLEEVGAPYTTQLLDYGASMKSADFLAINPMGKVPAIKHGDVIVTEGAAICAYLADAFPHAGLTPASGSPGRGAYYRWMFFGAGPIEAAMTNTALKVEVPEDMKFMPGYGSMADVTKAVNLAVNGRKYIAGDKFSAADVYFGSCVSWATQFGLMPKTPAVEAYLEGLLTRPAALRAKEIDDALMPKKG